MARLPNSSSVVVHDLGSVFVAPIMDAFQQASAKGIAVATDSMFQAMADVVDNSLRSKTVFTQTNKKILQSMKRAVLSEYRLKVKNHKRIREPYRARGTVPGWGRFAQSLGPALNSAGMFVADATTIHMVDRGRLDKEAAHWHRLNFGVGPQAEALGGARTFPVVFGDRSLGNIGLTEGPSHTPLVMPKGYWGKGDKVGFNPTGPIAFNPTQGIAARRFLDAGLQAFAEEMPIQYEQMLISMVEQMVRTGKGAAARTGTITPNVRFSGGTLANLVFERNAQGKVISADVPF